MARPRRRLAVPDPAEQARIREAILPAVPVLDRWLVTGTSLWDWYPCRCRHGTTRPRHCPCSGRTDLDIYPANCCAIRPRQPDPGRPFA